MALANDNAVVYYNWNFLSIGEVLAHVRKFNILQYKRLTNFITGLYSAVAVIPEIIAADIAGLTKQHEGFKV